MIYKETDLIRGLATRTSPPGAVGAVGDPFGQSRLDRSQRAPRVALSIRSADVRSLRVVPSGRPLLLPGPSTRPNRCPVTRADHFFESRSVDDISKKYFPSKLSSTSSHYVSAVKSIHYGGTRTSNLPLKKYGNLTP